MKENLNNLIDENSESGDEPDLIANNPVGDMMERLYREVMNNTISKEKKEEMNANCIMNNSHILDTKNTYITCNCNACPELGDYICYECYKTCHAGHNLKSRNSIQKVVNISQYCSCAEHGHERKEVKLKKEIIFDDKISCHMLKLIGKDSISTFYVDRSKNKFYCPFCVRNCLGDGKIKTVPIHCSKLRKEEFFCSCKDKKFHSNTVEDDTRLLKLFSDKKIDNDICVNKIIGNLIKNNDFKSIFINDLKSIYEDLKNSLLMEKRMRPNMRKPRYINEKYLNSVKFLKLFYQNLVVNNAFDINLDKVNFTELFEFDFVYDLFELFAKNKKEMSQSEINNSNDTCIIQLKIDCLYFFRVFIILPKASPFRRYVSFSDTENSSPLTRLIARKHFGEFVEELGWDKVRFIELIKNIWKTIERYDDHLEEYDLTEKLNSELINEYFEILIILSTLRYTTKEDINDFYHGVVIESFNSVVRMVKKYRIDSRNVKKRIEEFIYYTFLYYNDEIFFKEVISNSQQNSGKGQQNVFQRRLTKLKSFKSTTERSLNNKIISNNDNENANEIEEKVKEEDTETEFTNAKFIFEPNPISNSLINSLYAFKKETNDYTPEFQKWEIFDWLASEDDFYLEPIKSFYESYNLLETDCKLLSTHLRTFCKNCKEVENSNIVEINRNSFYKILKTNDEMMKIFDDFFHNNQKIEEFTKNLIEKINEMSKIFKETFDESQNNTIADKKIFQMYILKFGIFDNLYKIYNLFQINNFIAKSIPYEIQNELIISIFDFISLISQENLIILYILFSQKSIDLFLSLNKLYSNINSRVKFFEITYYLNWLKYLRKNNSKLNLNFFTVKLKELYIYLEDIMTKNISDKNFKFTQEQEKLGINTAKGGKKNFSKMLGKVREQVIEEKNESEVRSQFTMNSRYEAGKMKDEKMKMVKVELLNKKIVEKLKSEGEAYFNLDINFTSDDLIEKIIYIVFCLKKCCKLSSNKSILILNNNILDIIFKLYKSPFYYQIWEKYQKSFNDSLIDDGEKKYGVATIEVINKKLNDYWQASLIDTNENLTEKEHSLVLNIYQLLYKIDEYSFYLIMDEIPKFEIKTLLQNKIESMSFIDRKILSAVYMRYYFISPFNILSNLNKLNMSSMTRLPNCNVNGPIISTNKEEYTKTETKARLSESNLSFIKKKAKEPKRELFLSKENTGQKEEEKKAINRNQERAFKFLNRYRIVEQALGMDPLFTNLTKYRMITQKYMDKNIVPKPHLFIKYFKTIILFPSIFSLYKILYFTPIMTLHYKYFIYRIIVLFFQCLNYFYQVIIQNNNRFLKDEKYKAMFKSLFFANDDKDELFIIGETEDKIKEIIPNLSDLIKTMNKDPKFQPLDTPKLLEYLCEYIKHFSCLRFLPLNFNGKKFREDSDADSLGGSHLNINTNGLFAMKISSFISVYEKMKKEGIENQNNTLMNIFAEETGEDEPEKHQLKINIILDLMARINFKHNRKISIYARGKDNSFILVNIINKMYKIDPDLWHDCLVDITPVTKQVLHDIISAQLTFLIQHIYIDFHKLKDFNEDREGLNTGLSVKNKFLILIEFLRLFCENHHKIYQTILMRSNINKFYLRNIEEDLDLLNFVLKIPTLSKNSINYLNSKLNFVSIFKTNDSNSYFNDLIIGITDFLIEMIQGCFESNMRLFELPSDINKSAEDEKEIAKKKEEEQNIKLGFFNSIMTESRIKKKNIEKENVDFEKYIETGYYCLDNLQNDTDKLCLAQFLRFIICFLEEPFNPRENKERIIKMLNQKKMLAGLAECTVSLYKKYRDTLAKKNLQKKTESNDDIINLSIMDDEENNKKEEVEIPEEFNEDLINLYLTSSDLDTNLDFIISSNIFKFFLMSAQYKSAEKFRRCLKNLKTESEENRPIKVKKNRNEIIGRREAYRFFSKIVKDVEIFYKPKDKLTEPERKKFREFFTVEQYKEIEDNFQSLFALKGDVQKVAFFINPWSMFSRDSDLDTFINSFTGDKKERLNYLIEYMPTFRDSLSIRRKLWKKKNKLLNYLYNIDYNKAIIVATLGSLLINFIVLISTFYVNRTDIIIQETDNTASEEDTFFPLNEGNNSTFENNMNFIASFNSLPKGNNIIHSLRKLREEDESENEEKWVEDYDNQKTEEEAVSSEDGNDDTGNEIVEEEEESVWVRFELRTQIITFLTIINSIFILFLITNWFYFQILKYEKVDDEEDKDEDGGDNDEDSVSIDSYDNNKKKNNGLSIYEIIKKFMSSDEQILVWNLILGVIALFSVDFHFLYSIQLFTIVFIIKSMKDIIYIVQIRYDQFCSIGFVILLTSLFFSMIKFKWFTGNESCQSYSECFFDMINSGIRGGAGMGFGIKKLDQKGFFIEFFLEMCNFILVSLVFMNMITGIIVDSFGSVREKKNEDNEIKENTCYICSLHREKFEKNGIKFENHTEVEHNVINYFNYIFKVEMTDESELNSLDYQVLQSIKGKKTDFFPINTCLSLSSKNK